MTMSRTSAFREISQSWELRKHTIIRCQGSENSWSHIREDNVYWYFGRMSKRMAEMVGPCSLCA